jgi:hypothetical protein
MGNLIKPFPWTSLGTEKWIHNYRLSQNQQTVVCNFGCQQTSLGFSSVMNLPEGKAQIVTLAACVLRNMRIRRYYFRHP